MQRTIIPVLKFQIVEDADRSAPLPALIPKPADVGVAFDGDGIRDVTWVKIEEVAGRNWVLGGQALHAHAVRRRSKRSA